MQLMLLSIALNKSFIHTTSKHQDHDLEPSGGRNGLERREATRGHVGELEVLRHGEVARDPDSSLDGDDVEEAKHRRAAVLDLHNLISTWSYS